MNHILNNNKRIVFHTETLGCKTSTN